MGQRRPVTCRDSSRFDAGVGGIGIWLGFEFVAESIHLHSHQFIKNLLQFPFEAVPIVAEFPNLN